MLAYSKNSFTYIDEVAISTLSKQVESYIISSSHEAHQEIGFAVSIDFAPNEDSAQSAAVTLIKINQYLKHWVSKH